MTIALILVSTRQTFEGDKVLTLGAWRIGGSGDIDEGNGEGSADRERVQDAGKIRYVAVLVLVHAKLGLN